MLYLSLVVSAFFIGMFLKIVVLVFNDTAIFSKVFGRLLSPKEPSLRQFY